MGQANLIYCDLFNRQAAKSAGGDVLAFPPVVAGGTVSYALRFLEYLDTFKEVDQDISALRVSVGVMDARPLSGGFKLKVGVAASSSANTTPAMDWNTGAEVLAAALNALSAGTGDYECDDVSGGIVIRRTGGGAAVFSVVGNRLLPRSFGRIIGSDVDGEYVYELRLTVAPLAFADTAVRVLPNSPSVATVQNGGVDPSGTIIWNEIQALTVPNNFRGTYQLRYGYAKTDLLDLTAGAAEITAALNAMLAPLGGTVNVTNPTSSVAHIEFRGALAGIDLDPLEVQVYSAPPGDWTFDLDLTKAEVFEALRAASPIVVPFEAEADFYIDPADHSLGTRTRKLWNTTLTIKKPLIYPDMGVVPGVDWLWNNPRTYIPFSADQVITGQQHYVHVIGDGAAMTFDIAHGLATDGIAGITVRENHSGGRVIPSDEYEATVTGADAVQLVFPAAPDLNALVVVITSAGPTSAFEQHHHTIEEIGDTGDGGYVPTLLNALAALDTRLLALEGLVGRTDVVIVVSGNKKAEYSLPSVGEILPDISNEDSVATVASQVSAGSGPAAVTIGGTELEAQKALAASELAALQAEIAAVKAARDAAAAASAADAAAAVVVPKTTSTITRMTFPAMGGTPWPTLRNGKMPWLLPAINDASATTAAVLPVSPVAGYLYSAGAGFILPGGNGRKAQSVVSGDKFGYDGRCFYRVSANGDSWSAMEMERELLRAVIRPEQFPAGSDLAMAWSLTGLLLCDEFDAGARGLARTVDGAEYLLMVEAVPLPDASTPGTPGPNVGAEGAVVVLSSSRITLSPATEENSFSMALKRDSTGAGSGTVTRYGSGAATPTLPTGAFVLRVRLAAFDVDDTSADPRGQVSLAMPASALTVTLTR